MTDSDLSTLALAISTANVILHGIFLKIIIIPNNLTRSTALFAFKICFYIFTVLKENIYKLESKIIYFGQISQTFRLAENASAAFKVPGRKGGISTKTTLNAQIVNIFNSNTHIYIHKYVSELFFMISTLVSNVAPILNHPLSSFHSKTNASISQVCIML